MSVQSRSRNALDENYRQSAFALGAHKKSDYESAYTVKDPHMQFYNECR